MTAVRTQACLYAVAYWNSFFWFVCIGVYGTDDFRMEETQSDPFPLALQQLVWIFFPLQGFINFLVYTRPRFVARRERLPQESAWQAFRKVVVDLEPVSETAHLTIRRGQAGGSSSRMPSDSFQVDGSASKDFLGEAQQVNVPEENFFSE